MTKHAVIHRVDDRAEGRADDLLARASEDVQRLSRRKFLTLAAATAAGLLLPSFPAVSAERPAARGRSPLGVGETDRFVFPRLQFTVIDNTPDRWNIGPVGEANLRVQLERLTNVRISAEPKIVRLDDFDDMARHPFVFMTSEGDFDLPQGERRNLREYLERGGFVLADDCVYREQDIFFRCYRRHIDGLFPDNPMRELPPEHEIFHCYFDFPRGCPHMQGRRFGRTNAAGLFERGTGRLMTFATPGDLHCGWMCRYWGMDKNMEAIKMGINIIVYFLSH